MTFNPNRRWAGVYFGRVDTPPALPLRSSSFNLDPNPQQMDCFEHYPIHAYGLFRLNFERRDEERSIDIKAWIEPSVSIPPLKRNFPHNQEYNERVLKKHPEWQLGTLSGLFFCSMDPLKVFVKIEKRGAATFWLSEYGHVRLIEALSPSLFGQVLQCLHKRLTPTPSPITNSMLCDYN